jgi:hypothetical protein
LELFPSFSTKEQYTLAREVGREEAEGMRGETRKMRRMSKRLTRGRKE